MGSERESVGFQLLVKKEHSYDEPLECSVNNEKERTRTRTRTRTKQAA